MAIQVEIEGFDSPLEFPDGTDPAVIQRKVKELVTGIDQRTGEKVGTITQDSLGRRVKEWAKKDAPAMAGGVATGIAAAATGPVSVPLMAGAVAIGAAGGEAYKQIGQHLSGSLDAPRTSIEAAKRIAKKGIEEGTFEAFGGLAAKGVGKILAPFKKDVTREAAEVMQYFKDKIKPVVLLPAEATESRTLDLLQNVTEASLIGGNKISKYKNERTKFFDDFADSIIDEFGQRTDPSDLGNLFVAAVESKQRVHNNVAKILYNNVSEDIAMGGGKRLAPLGAEEGTKRVYHGRVGPLRATSRHGDIGVHFTEELDTAAEMSSGEHLVRDFGAKKAGPPSEGVIHAMDIDPEKFVELPDLTDWSGKTVAEVLKDQGIRVRPDHVLGDLADQGYDGIKYINEYEGNRTYSYIVDPEKAMESSVPRRGTVSPESFSQGEPLTVSTDSMKKFSILMKAYWQSLSMKDVWDWNCRTS